MKLLPSHFLSALAGLTLILAGCQTTGRGVAGYEAASSQIQRGKTTRSQVIAVLGEPKRREISPRGETWIYGAAAGRNESGAFGRQLVRTGIGVVPYAGSALSLAETAVRPSVAAKPGARVTFDKRGVVSDYVVQLP